MFTKPQLPHQTTTQQTAHTDHITPDHTVSRSVIHPHAQPRDTNSRFSFFTRNTAVPSPSLSCISCLSIVTLSMSQSSFICLLPCYVALDSSSPEWSEDVAGVVAVAVDGLTVVVVRVGAREDVEVEEGELAVVDQYKSVRRTILRQRNQTNELANETSKQLSE